jgi:hypothetical protein
MNLSIKPVGRLFIQLYDTGGGKGKMQNADCGMDAGGRGEGVK